MASMLMMCREVNAKQVEDESKERTYEAYHALHVLSILLAVDLIRAETNAQQADLASRRRICRQGRVGSYFSMKPKHALCVERGCFEHEE